MGEPTNELPGSFWTAPIEEAAQRLAAILREENADVLTIAMTTSAITGIPIIAAATSLGLSASAKTYELNTVKDRSLRCASIYRVRWRRILPRPCEGRAAEFAADELVVELVDAAVQGEEGGAELLRLLVAERSGRHAADCLPLEELAEDLDQAENELREAALQRALVGLYTRRNLRAALAALAAREGQVVGAVRPDRGEQCFQPQRDQIDARDGDVTSPPAATPASTSESRRSTSASLRQAGERIRRPRAGHP